MSDTPQGPGWWQASDDKWYPPPRPDLPVHDPGAAGASPPTPGTPAENMVYGTGGGIPAPQGPGRGVLYGALGVIGVLALVTAGIALLGDAGGSNTTAGDATDPAGDQTGSDCPQAGTELGDDLVLVNCGFSTVKDGASLTPTFGFVVENTGDEVRMNAGFTVTLFDAEGAQLDVQDPLFKVIPPRDKMGFGYTAYSWDATAAPAAAMEIAYKGLSVLAEDAEIGEGSFVTSNVKTSVNQTGPTVTTTFNVSSTYLEQVDNPLAHVIYRNAEGEIIGGHHAYSPSFVGPESRGSSKVTTYGEIEDLDPDKTLAYVDFGY